MTGVRANGAGGALAWLAHPVTVASTVVLIINDHLLKQVWAGPVTGKLSDVAGLVMAPALLAVAVGLIAPRLRGDLIAGGAIAVVGIGFAAVKATRSGAHAASQAWSVVSGPSWIRADATDLLALPTLALAWWVWRRVRYRPAPDRVVRSVRVCVVLPVAALATMATSPSPATPSATSVGVGAGLPVIQSQYGPLVSTDGKTWIKLDHTVDVEPGRTQACVPDQPRRCYRVVAGRLAVQHSDDGGTSWAIAWQISEGRQRFLARGYLAEEGSSDLSRARPLASQELVVTGRGDGHLVVVANGRDGYLIRYPTGDWQRIGFPWYSSDPPTDAPLSLTEPWQRIHLEYLLGIAIIAAVLLAAVELARRERGSMAALDKIGPAILAICLAALALATAALPEMRSTDVQLTALVFCSPGMLVWLATLAGGRVLTRRQAATIMPLAPLTGAAVVAPYVGWSAGWPDGYHTATFLALAGGAVFATLTLILARRTHST